MGHRTDREVQQRLSSLPDQSLRAGRLRPVPRNGYGLHPKPPPPGRRPGLLDGPVHRRLTPPARRLHRTLPLRSTSGDLGDNFHKRPMDHGRAGRPSIARAAPQVLGRVVRVEHRGKRVPVGLGIERVAIAFLSRRGWLIPAVWTTWRVVRPVIKRK